MTTLTCDRGLLAGLPSGFTGISEQPPTRTYQAGTGTLAKQDVSTWLMSPSALTKAAMIWLEQVTEMVEWVLCGTTRWVALVKVVVASSAQ